MSTSSPIESASLILARSGPPDELYLVRRAEQLRFFGGYYVFPGGKVDDEDRQTADPRRTAAVRELFEETGILLARFQDGTFPGSTEQWTQERHALIDDALLFGEFLRKHELSIRSTDLQFVATLTTPAFSPLRFETSFFVASSPPGQTASVIPGELEDGRWTSASELLSSWLSDELLVSAPTVYLTELIKDRSPFELTERMKPMIRRLDEGRIPPIQVAPSIWFIPLKSAALPPTDYTNAYLIGTDHLYLIDPGANIKEEQERLFELIDFILNEKNRALKAIVLTHHHPDHVDAASVCAERYQVPILAHPQTATVLAEKVQVNSFLHEGDRLQLGRSPDGQGEWYFEAMLTPGHASGHLAFWDPQRRILLGGDLVSMVSSVIIAPPDGDLLLYLDSLRRMQALEARLLLVGHGPPSTKANEVLERAVQHRLKRERALIESLDASSPRTIASLVEELYEGLESKLRRLAELQVWAGLRKLHTEGKVSATTEEDPLKKQWSRNQTNPPSQSNDSSFSP